MAGKMVKSLGGNSSSQSVRDRLNAAKHSISGSGLAKSICKATTDQVISPKPKHLNYLTLCTNEPNVSIPEMADKLLQRTQDTSWVVVFKALITVHNLMNQGNERFTQYVASNNRSVNLQTFSDKSGVQGYDMSLFIRRYARYINQKAISYRTMAFDFCRVKRGKTDGVLRTMGTEKLLKALPVIQEQVDALVDFDATPNELCNNVINAAFILLFNDLIRLFACYNDGVINLLEQYFDMNKKQCREALDIYKKFVLRMEKVSAFLRVAERFGIDKGDIPDLAKAPSSLLEALEQHLASLEGRKVSGAGASAGAAQSATSNASGSRAGGDKGAAGTGSQVNGSGNAGLTLTQAERQKIIEEEKMRLAAFKEQRQLSLERMAVTVNQSAAPMAPVKEEPPPTAAAIAPPAGVGTTSSAPAPAAATAARPSDDLLGMFEGAASVPAAAPAPAPAPASASAWPAQTGFGREVNFEAAFGSQTQPSSEFGNILQPQSTKSAVTNQTPTLSGDNVTSGASSVITADIDMSLASLAGNLNMADSGNMKKQDHKWINPPPTMQQRTGGTAFAGPTIASGPTINWTAAAAAAPPAVAMTPVIQTGVFPNYAIGAQSPMAPATWQQPPGMYPPGVFPPGPYPGVPAPAMVIHPAAQQPFQPPQQQPNFFPVPQRPPPSDPFGL